jgi:hypothetical protein
LGRSGWRSGFFSGWRFSARGFTASRVITRHVDGVVVLRFLHRQAHPRQLAKHAEKTGASHFQNVDVDIGGIALELGQAGLYTASSTVLPLFSMDLKV